jgi:hypothetical protein
LLTPLLPSVRVYNLEIHGEHVYEVGEFGVLVHDSGPSCELGKALSDKVASAARAIRAAGNDEILDGVFL